MRSATSFFNPTLYRKTMARFWPLWALYGVMWLFLFPLNLLNAYFDYLDRNLLPEYLDPVTYAQATLLDRFQDLPIFLESGVFIALIAGILCAMAVFGYLYNNRSAGMMHTLPMRRETLFTTQYLAGLSFLLLPHLVVALLLAAMALVLLPSASWGDALQPVLLWLAVQSGTCLFFFSFAAFCAMFTGHILALPAFYGILNALVSVIYYLITALMERFFFGFPGNIGSNRLVELLTPVWALAEACEWRTLRSDVEPYEVISYYLESPGTVAGYAAAGLVFAVLALMVYRVRHVESAGDVVSISIVRPFFQCGVSFCSGLCFGVYTAAFFGWYEVLPMTLCILLWTVVGWFVAEMLLKKSFRVLGAWKGSLVMAAVLAVLCASCSFDFFGVTGRVPSAGEVDSLSVSSYMGAPYDDGELQLNEVTDPGHIQKIVDLHQAIVNDRHRCDRNATGYMPGDDSISLEVTYLLKDGSSFTRDYNGIPIYRDELAAEGSVTWQAQQLIRDRSLVARCYDFDYYETLRLVEVSLDGVYNIEHDTMDWLTLDTVTGQDLERLWQAVRTDFNEGTIGVRYLFEDNDRRANTYRTDLRFHFERPPEMENGKYITPSASSELTITLTPNARHTLKWLEETGVLGENYSLMPYALLEGDYKEPTFPETVISSYGLY